VYRANFNATRRDRFREHGKHLIAAARASNPEHGAQAALLYDIFGIPSLPATLDLFAIALDHRPLRQLAQSIYTNNSFNGLRFLADELQVAGCAEAAILDHLRGPGPHVLGCWLRFVDCQYRQSC
jgi:hypothetical protein